MTTFSLARRSLLLGAVCLAACSRPVASQAGPDPYAASSWRKLTDADWRGRLPPAAYGVLRHSDTERPFTSPLLGEHRRGVFACLGCGLPLFKSDWKFESGTGWPSFYTAFGGAVGHKSDFLLGYERTEYHCAQCLGHQGHVFNDGPRPTGLRYCNNGVALKFTPPDPGRGLQADEPGTQLKSSTTNFTKNTNGEALRAKPPSPFWGGTDAAGVRVGKLRAGLCACPTEGAWVRLGSAPRPCATRWSAGHFDPLTSLTDPARVVVWLWSWARKAPNAAPHRVSRRP